MSEPYSAKKHKTDTFNLMTPKHKSFINHYPFTSHLN